MYANKNHTNILLIHTDFVSLLVELNRVGALFNNGNGENVTRKMSNMIHTTFMSALNMRLSGSWLASLSIKTGNNPEPLLYSLF